MWLADRLPALAARFSVAYGGKQILRDIALAVHEGEIVGLVGPSGSGKSTITLAILGLLAMKGGHASGEILLGGRDLLRLSERELRAIRGREISLVLQSPHSALNPLLRIGTQLNEAWRAHSADRHAAGTRITELLDAVQLPADRQFLRRYPGQLSVGQAQRVLIAMALLHRPRLLLADEPTAALDPVTARDTLELLSELNRRFGMSVLYVSHDLLSVSAICDRVAVLYEGEIVECGPTEQVLTRPSHFYSRRLVAAMPFGRAMDVSSRIMADIAPRRAGAGTPVAVREA